MKLRKQSLSQRVIALIEGARQKVATAANLAQVYTNYEIGRQIVEEEQGGKRRAGYGEKIIEDLSAKLTARFGRGWSVRNLRVIRQFYVEYSTDEIRRELIAKSETMNSAISDCRIGNQKDLAISDCRIGRRKDLANTVCQIRTPTGLPLTPDFVLSWTHYLVLMRIEDRQERYFYEMEAEGNDWSVRDLHCQMQKQLYQRLGVANGKDKEKLLAYLHRKVKRIEANDVLKDPYVLDFLGLPECPDYSESELERRIIDHIQEFMLELGNGFFFGGRQVRLSFGDDHFYADLVFYNRLLRCFFVIDLKIGKVTHKDLGQMQTYVHYYDRMVKQPDENPTIGILLCSDDDKALVEMTLPEAEKKQIFARRFSAIVPSKKRLASIVLEEKRKYEKEKLLVLAAKKTAAVRGK